MNQNDIEKRRNYVKANLLDNTIPELAFQCGVSTYTIERDIAYLKKFEKMRSKTQQRRQIAITIRKNGNSKFEISEALGVSIKTVEWYLKKGKC